MSSLWVYLCLFICLSAWPKAMPWLAVCAAAAFALGLQWGPCAMDADSQWSRGEERTAITACILKPRNKKESGGRCRFVCVCLSVSLCEGFSALETDECKAVCRYPSYKNRSHWCTCQSFSPLLSLSFSLSLSPWAICILLSNHRSSLTFSPLSLHFTELFLSHHNPQLLLPWLHCTVLECTLKLIVNNPVGYSGSVCGLYTI